MEHLLSDSGSTERNLEGEIQIFAQCTAGVPHVDSNLEQRIKKIPTSITWNKLLQSDDPTTAPEVSLNGEFVSDVDELI